MKLKLPTVPSTNVQASQDSVPGTPRIKLISKTKTEAPENVLTVTQEGNNQKDQATKQEKQYLTVIIFEII